jgi:hypothetical protein
MPLSSAVLMTTTTTTTERPRPENLHIVKSYDVTYDTHENGHGNA